MLFQGIIYPMPSSWGQSLVFFGMDEWCENYHGILGRKIDIPFHFLYVIILHLLYYGSILGGRSARRAFEFGRTYVVRPKGKHQATIVWLHGLGDNGSR